MAASDLCQSLLTWGPSRSHRKHRALGNKLSKLTRKTCGRRRKLNTMFTVSCFRHRYHQLAECTIEEIYNGGFLLKWSPIRRRGLRENVWTNGSRPADRRLISGPRPTAWSPPKFLLQSRNGFQNRVFFESPSKENRKVLLQKCPVQELPPGEKTARSVSLSAFCGTRGDVAAKRITGAVPKPQSFLMPRAFWFGCLSLPLQS